MNAKIITICITAILWWKARIAVTVNDYRIEKPAESFFALP